MYYLFGLIMAAILGVLGIASTKPNTFKIERSTTIKSTPEKISELVSNFHNWALWSPYDKIDADLKKTFSGSAHGKGAIYEWEGKKTGIGRMEILDSSHSKITIKLDFTKPMEAHNTCEFSFTKKGDETEVTWSMEGKSNFMGKVMDTIMSMDKMLGKDFSSGLAKMKEVAEAKK
jgi:hypothetical protein